MYSRRQSFFRSKTAILVGIGFIIVVFAVVSVGAIGKGKAIVSPVPDSSGVKIIFVAPSSTPEASVAGQMDETSSNN